MAHNYTNYIQRIRERGYRMTPQRQIVLDTVCTHGGHATAGEIYDTVNSQQPAINRATVYRILDFLCEMQLVAKADIAGRTVFELVGESPHHHLVCRQCQQIVSFADHHFDDLAAHLWADHGFQADLTHLVISGLCAECVKQQA